jgi:hypothetical protein
MGDGKSMHCFSGCAAGKELLGSRWGIILIRISKKYDGRLWTGFIWLSRGAASLNGAFFFFLGYVAWYVDTHRLWGYVASLATLLSFFLAP